MPDPLEIVCLGCGCLCDDFPVLSNGGKFRPVDGFCPKGAEWFSTGLDQPQAPIATFEGRPIDADEAIERAARLLDASRMPWIGGLIFSTIETVREAVALAEMLRGVIVRADADQTGVEALVTSSVGKVTATLGEVRDRADVVLFWRADPESTHPRHGERFSIDPVGRFIPEGRRGRTILVADREVTATARRADRFLKIAPCDDDATIQRLRALLQGRPIPGSCDPMLHEWAEILRKARYSAIFHDRWPKEPAILEALFLLARDLNDISRGVILPMGGPVNPAGAGAVLTWQTGCPMGAKYWSGRPEPWRIRGFGGYESGTIGAAIGGPDLALIVGMDRLPRISPEVNTIWIGPGATRDASGVTIALNAARPGIDGDGTVVRCDGAWLRLNPPLPARYPTEREWLRRVRERLDGPPT